ncbi:MAG: pyridoxal phosphate-dependent aminotransferase [Bryobacterales bacterium]|nr:pyridoxal phosphate-dependent aminotransferase [Bryobacterales bacterium]
MRYSSRLPWSAPQNALTQRLAVRRAAGLPILDLTESNPTRAGIAYPGEELLRALADPAALTYEPTAEGLASARAAIAAYHGVAPEHVLLTASTSEAYAFLFKLLCDPGDEILVPRPSYPLFEFLAAVEAVAVRQYPLRYQEGWWIDVPALAALITPRTKAIVVVSPNNPTGSYLKRAELAALESVCVSHGLALISDEVFAEFSLEDPPDPLRAPPCSATFSLNGFSKLLGLPQMKLGWIVTRDAEARTRLELIADTFLSVSAPVQHAAAHWLALHREGFIASMQERLRGNLALLGTRALRVEGGWYAILRMPRTRGEEEWAIELLEQDGVLIQPGYFYDFETEAFAVVSLLTRPDVFAEGISRILKRLDA